MEMTGDPNRSQRKRRTCEKLRNIKKQQQKKSEIKSKNFSITPPIVVVITDSQTKMYGTKVYKHTHEHVFYNVHNENSNDNDNETAATAADHRNNNRQPPQQPPLIQECHELVEQVQAILQHELNWYHKNGISSTQLNTPSFYAATTPISSSSSSSSSSNSATQAKQKLVHVASLVRTLFVRARDVQSQLEKLQTSLLVANNIFHQSDDNDNHNDQTNNQSPTSPTSPTSNDDQHFHEQREQEQEQQSAAIYYSSTTSTTSSKTSTTTSTSTTTNDNARVNRSNSSTSTLYQLSASITNSIMPQSSLSSGESVHLYDYGFECRGVLLTTLHVLNETYTLFQRVQNKRRDESVAASSTLSNYLRRPFTTSANFLVGGVADYLYSMESKLRKRLRKLTVVVSLIEMCDIMVKDRRMRRLCDASVLQRGYDFPFCDTLRIDDYEQVKRLDTADFLAHAGSQFVPMMKHFFSLMVRITASHGEADKWFQNDLLHKMAFVTNNAYFLVASDHAASKCVQYFKEVTPERGSSLWNLQDHMLIKPIMYLGLPYVPISRSLDIPMTIKKIRQPAYLMPPHHDGNSNNTNNGNHKNKEHVQVVESSMLPAVHVDGNLTENSTLSLQQVQQEQEQVEQAEQERQSSFSHHVLFESFDRPSEAIFQGHNVTRDQPHNQHNSNNTQLDDEGVDSAHGVNGDDNEHDASNSNKEHVHLTLTNSDQQPITIDITEDQQYLPEGSITPEQFNHQTQLIPNLLKDQQYAHDSVTVRIILPSEETINVDLTTPTTATAATTATTATTTKSPRSTTTGNSSNSGSSASQNGAGTTSDYPWLTSIVKVCYDVKNSMFGKSEEIGQANESRYGSVILHIHGGGFVAMSSFSHECYLRLWARKAQIPIVSVDYRHAPDHRFPTQVEECYNVYQWVVNHAHEFLFGGRPLKRIVVTGDSAGGNLTLGVTMRAVYDGFRVPDAIALTYPATYLSQSPSPARLMALVDPLVNMNFLTMCESSLKYRGDIVSMEEQSYNAYISPAIAPDEVFRCFPPTYMNVGSLDPLFDDAIYTARRIHSANGGRLRLDVYDGMGHGYLNLVDFVPEAREAALKLVQWILDMIDELNNSDEAQH